MTDIQYIDSNDALAAALPILRPHPRIAIDTEADSLHHYFEKVCLIQISVPGHDLLIDPLADIDLSPLLEILAPAQLIIQGADYDLRMLRRDYGFVATSIFDTMLAAQLLGYERFSYAALVERHAGVVLCKAGQKADWSQRPLPEKLIHYAASDTHYLTLVAERLEQELKDLGRLEWLYETSERLLEYVQEGMRAPDPERQWRIKGWHTVKPGRGWAYLRELWQWRDQEAQRLDFPPFKVVRNETLIELALWAQDGFNPEAAPKLPKNIIGRRRRELDKALATGKAMRAEDFPKPLESTRRDFRAVDDVMVSRLRKVRDEHAAALKLDPGVLLPAAAISTISGDRPKTLEDLSGKAKLFRWQISVLGQDIIDVVSGKVAPDAPKEAAEATVTQN